MFERTAEGTFPESDLVQGSFRVFGLPIVDSLLPDGIPVPCSVLVTAEPGSGNDIISTAIIQEHLSSSLSVPFQEQKALWLSLDNFISDLRNSIDYPWLANQPKIQFIDCYSSQIGIDSKERYYADPSNLPHLSMVTSSAISELNEGGRLLVILDSLTSLIQKVGVRRSTEFFRTLVGKTRSISADLLTTLNRRAFTEATMATFADIADIVIDLAVEENESSAGKLRVRKARNVRHYLGWRNYKIDFERRTFQYDSLPLQEPQEVRDDAPIIAPKGFAIDASQDDLASDDRRFAERKASMNVPCEGSYCTFGGRAITERERLAIFAETVNALGRKYQEALHLMEQALATKHERGTDPHSDELLKGISDQITSMDRLFKLVQSNNKIHPSIRQSSLGEVIQRALTDSIVPTNVTVEREPNGSLEIRMDPALVARALSGVIEAAVQEMPRGGALSIRDYKEGDMAVIAVRSSGLGNWSNDLFELGDMWNSSAGLGLVVAHKFIEAHGGQVHIKSEQGKGTTFTVRLPI